MEELIDIINQLQDVFNAAGVQEFDLPQIVVVGTQSSGKSSVLEHLVGRSFLPRGPGVVTRCPLVLQLVNIPNNHDDYAIFQHKKADVFDDYQMITKELESQTEYLTGGDKGICSIPISLKMYSKTFTNLTLVDLPGITKVPVGSQPEDIEKQTKDLIHEYINKQNCIILAVIPANVDMATCESLKIAREVDPEGARTLAVVTKLDLMDQGTDARAMLSGRIIPVKLGIIGVVNRSQKGIIENKSMYQSLKDEEEFFSKNYKDLQSFNGTPYLIKTIQGILISNIEQCLPGLKEQIEQKLQLKKSELNKLGITKSDSPTLLLDLIFKLSSNFCATINGTLDKIDTKELNGGGRIYKIFCSTSAKLEEIHALTDLSEDEIMIAHRNSFGINATGLVSNVAFEFLVKKQIKQLLSPCLSCVDSVHKELIKIIENCIYDPELQLEGYSNLQNKLSCAALALLESRLEITRKMVHNIINIHLAYINYDNVDLSHCAEDVTPKAADAINLDEEKVSVYNSTVKKIESYFCSVRRYVMDMLPKVIMCFMVNTIIESLHSELMSRLSQDEDCDLLQESSEFLDKRNQIKKSLSTLEKAYNILNSLKLDNRRHSTFNSSEKITSSDTIQHVKENVVHNRSVWLYNILKNTQNSLFVTYLLLGLFLCYVVHCFLF